MRRSAFLFIAVAVTVGLSFAAAQTAGRPERGRFMDVFRVGHQVIVTETSDGTAFRLELLTDKEADEARQAHEAAMANVEQARKAHDEALARVRELRGNGDAPIQQDAYSRAYGERERARDRLLSAEQETRRQVREFTIVGDDYVSYEAERTVHIPAGRIVSVTQWIK